MLLWDLCTGIWTLDLVVVFFQCHICSPVLLGPDRACKVWAQVGLGLVRAWPGGRAWGLDCRLSPKTRPARAWALGLCSKSQSQSLHCGLVPGPAPALISFDPKYTTPTEPRLYCLICKNRPSEIFLTFRKSATWLSTSLRSAENFVVLPTEPWARRTFLSYETLDIKTKLKSVPSKRHNYANGFNRRWKSAYSLVGYNQGDQMSLRKKIPKCSPTHFCQ
jgi:hypothetical protein